MKTFEITVSESLLNKVLKSLQRFPENEVTIRDTSAEQFLLDLASVQENAKQFGLDKMTDKEIQDEIDAVRTKK